MTLPLILALTFAFCAGYGVCWLLWRSDAKAAYDAAFIEGWTDSCIHHCEGDADGSTHDCFYDNDRSLWLRLKRAKPYDSETWPVMELSEEEADAFLRAIHGEDD